MLIIVIIFVEQVLDRAKKDKKKVCVEPMLWVVEISTDCSTASSLIMRHVQRLHERDTPKREALKPEKEENLKE